MLRVFAHPLAQVGFVAADIEQVVGNLKCQPNSAAVLLKCIHLDVVGPGHKTP